MYEDLPYPPRDPKDEVPAEPFAVDPPSTPAAIAHHLHAGRLDFVALGRPFRILIAGGGTGDATVMAAVSFHMAQIPVQIVHCDLSAASIDIAKRRLEAHMLSPAANVTFYQRSFLEVQAGDLGGLFDFANAVGVVHHLASPIEGLRALRRLLQPQGGLFLMVYGALGRTGVYDVQTMWRLSGLSRRDFLAGPLQALLAALPATNRFSRNQRMMGRKVVEGDLSTLSDLLVHHCDHAYDLASLLELLSEADLHAIALADTSRYALPADVERKLTMLTRLTDRWQRAYFGELYRGDVIMHLLWAGPGSAAREPAEMASDMVLCPAWAFVGYRILLSAQERTRCLGELKDRGSPSSCVVYIDYVGYEDLPCPAVALLERLDCARSVRELAGELRAAAIDEVKAADPGQDEAEAMVRGLYSGFLRKGQQQVFLVQQGMRFRRPAWREKRIPRVVLRRHWAEPPQGATPDALRNPNELQGDSGQAEDMPLDTAWRPPYTEGMEL